MTVTRLAEEEVQHFDAPQPAPFPAPSVSQILAVLAALAQTISPRLTHILFGIGGFVLAWRTLDNPTVLAIQTLAVCLSFMLLLTAVFNAKRGT